MLDEIKEIPIDDSQITEDTEETPQEVEKRSRLISSVLYKRLGILILVLCGIALPLTILSYFFNEGQPDPVLLMIEQIVGFVLTGIALIVGTSLLFTARRLKAKEKIVLEPIDNEPIAEM
jgi:hypothetical protein